MTIETIILLLSLLLIVFSILLSFYKKKYNAGVALLITLFSTLYLLRLNGVF